VVQLQFDKPECRRDPLTIGRRAAAAAPDLRERPCLPNTLTAM
jgi:hypothetical protein